MEAKKAAERPQNLQEEWSTKYVQNLLRVLIPTGGLMLTLIWGLLGLRVITEALPYIRLATIVLGSSIVLSLLCLQFIVSAIMKKENNQRDEMRQEKATEATKTANNGNVRDRSIASKRSVALTFLVAWISFVAGVGIVVIAIFNIN